MKKLANRNVTTAILAAGVAIMTIGGILVSPPEPRKFTLLNYLTFVFGLIIMMWGLFRAITREHKD